MHPSHWGKQMLQNVEGHGLVPNNVPLHAQTSCSFENASHFCFFVRPKKKEAHFKQAVLWIFPALTSVLHVTHCQRMHSVEPAGLTAVAKFVDEGM